MTMKPLPTVSVQGVQELSPDLPLIPLSHGSRALPSTVSSLLPSLLDRAYLLMPIQPLHRMLGIGGDRTGKLTLEMEQNLWHPGGISTTLEQDLRQISLSDQSRMESSGSMKTVPQMLLRFLGHATLQTIQLSSRSLLLVLRYLKTSTSKALVAIVSHLREPPAEAHLDLVQETEEVTTVPAMLPQLHMESEM
ncbi:ORF8b [Pipistrellus bat coronavirus HKU5]|uniref:ORF8b n=1 Tax=Bat coronavirus HKU5 TaxID=694008 RepID=UPI0018A18A7D|nr:ORF8b [Pipistrellus bat coronavirus HKU5]